MADSQTFEEVVERHHASAYRAALAIMRSHHDAQDVVQSALLRAYVRRRTFRGDAGLGSWLIAIVRNQAIDHRRAQRRRWHRTVTTLSDPAVLERLVSGDRSPEELLLEDERRRHLSACVEMLPPSFRKTLQLAQGDYSYRDIATLTRTPLGTVKSRIWAARRIIGRRLRQVSGGVAMLIVCFTGGAFGQSAPSRAEFDVAEVKVNDSGQQGIQTRILASGQMSVRNIQMRALIIQAYKAADAVGGPTWLDTERVDLVAKAPPNTTEDTLRLMLQNLLIQRFKLAVHREQKIMPTYALVADRRKVRLAPAAGAGQPTCRPGQGAEGLNHTVCTNFTMADLANWLSTRIAPSFVTRPVVDRTGLNGTYDIRLDWVPQPLVGSASDAGDAPTGGATIFEALEKQLGLRLESRKLPVSIVVIDHIERVTTEN